MTILRSERALAGEPVLVVGGRGFVGSHVVRALIGEGARPHLFGPAMQEDLLADVAGRFVEHVGSIADRHALTSAFAASRARLVVSCAAHGVGRIGLMRSGESDHDGALEINVGGLGKLLEAAQSAGVERLVWASSTVVYGPASLYGDRPVAEDAPLAPTTYYGLTKQLAEALADYHRRRFALATVALRLPLVLGAGLWYQGAAAALADLFARVGRGESARLVFHDETLDLMHVGDAARAFVTALSCGASLAPVYNLEGFRARASDLLTEIGRQRPDVETSREHAPPALTLPLVDGAAFMRETGFAPRVDLQAFVAAMLGQRTGENPR